MISILVIGSLRSPPPFPLRRTFPHPGDRIKRSMLSCRDMIPLLSIHSAPACGGKVVAPATKGRHTEMVPEVYDSLFFPHIPRFPLRGNASKRQKGVQGRASKWHSIAVPTVNQRPVSFGLLTLGHTFGVRIQRIQRIHRVPRVQRGRGERVLCSKSHKKRTPEGVLFFHSH